MNKFTNKYSYCQQRVRSYGQIKTDQHPTNEDHESWVSDSGSSSESKYSTSSSLQTEWESRVNPNGEVFYIESMMESFTIDKNKIINSDQCILPELNRRRSSRAGKFMRLIKRKESYRHSVRISGLASEFKKNHEIISRIKEQTYMTENLKSAEKYTVKINIDPERKHRFGRRASACEAFFGIIPKITTESKIIVAGFVPGGEALKNKEIKIGDCLQSINGKKVDDKNLTNILSKFVTSSIVTCDFERIGGNRSGRPTQSILARQLVDQEGSQILMNSLIKEPLGVICGKIKEFLDGDSDMQGVFYVFPKCKNANPILSITKGAFITLNHMLPDVLNQKPFCSSIMTPHGLTHIIYFTCKDELLLLSIPKKCCSKEEAVILALDIMCTLSFTHENLSKCFVNEENHLYLDHFFYTFFSHFYKDKNNLLLNDSNIDKNYNFDFLLPVANYIQLPRDAQIQIDAALSEMEAMDYRNWNQDSSVCQRLYTILGSCLYHKKYLLCSHLPSEDLIQINSYLRIHGLLNLINNEQVKSIVIWKKIYPSSCINKKFNLEVEQAYLPTHQWFLLVVGCGHNLLAVILESGGCTAGLEEIYGPDIFYIEEAQETLRHIKKIGIFMLADKWINTNAKPKIIIHQNEPYFLKTSLTMTENLVSVIKLNQSRPSTSNINKISYDKASTTKSKSDSKSEDSRTELNIAYTIETSRDSPSQDSLSQVSEVSDQTLPVLGRRATREKNITSKVSDQSDSDLDDNSIGISDISYIRENLLNQAEYIAPKIITTGKQNYLVYFIKMDIFQGHLITSKVELNHEFLIILNTCCQKIDKFLNDIKRYKNLLSLEPCKTLVNKSLIAIKEHGVLFKWDGCSFWVIGRLFTIPKPTELFLCYEDCVPQNLIEMAYRLQLVNN